MSRDTELAPKPLILAVNDELLLRMLSGMSPRNVERHDLATALAGRAKRVLPSS